MPLPLPPKAQRQASLPSKTAAADDVHYETADDVHYETADDVHYETADELKHTVPQETTTTGGAKCAVSTETDAEMNTSSDAGSIKEVTYRTTYICICIYYTTCLMGEISTNLIDFQFTIPNF